MRGRPLLLLAIVAGVVVVPVGAASATPAGGWTEGFTLSIDRDINCGIQGGGFLIAEVDARKTFAADGTLSSSTFEIFLQGGGQVPTRTVSVEIGPTVVDVPVDPDYLSVSTDLGWAGLDAAVELHDAVSDTDVPVETHLSLFAVTGVTHQDGRYTRTALAAPEFLHTFGSFVNVLGHSAPDGKVIVVDQVPFGGISFLTTCPVDVSIFSTRPPF